jgi:alpha-tubulin suppressor-like RCC1 family protein
VNPSLSSALLALVLPLAGGCPSRGGGDAATEKTALEEPAPPEAAEPDAAGETETAPEGALVSVEALAAGGSHTCALLESGRVFCWGANTDGQLGDGSTESSPAPVAAAGLGTDAVAVAAGERHTCALLRTGSVKCWGNGANGRLGDGTTKSRTVPTIITALSGGARALAAGSAHTCAVLRTGRVACWGLNAHGQLGDGTTKERHSPVEIEGVSGAVAVAAGGSHTCALLDSGKVKCWGENGEAGKLGNGGTDDSRVPVLVRSLGGPAAAIAAGRGHTCAVLSAGGVRCWGEGGSGQLGVENPSPGSLPLAPDGLKEDGASISAGRSHTCAVLKSGGMRCWGNNGGGQLGDSTLLDRPTPRDVDLPGQVFKGVGAGDMHTCGLLVSGRVACWGDGGDGRLGYEPWAEGPLPQVVEGLGAGAAAIADGGDHACALLDTGEIVCWGRGGSAQIGDGTTRNRSLPAAVAGIEGGARCVAAGWRHTCAVLRDGPVVCWGSNALGQAGSGSKALAIASPVRVKGLAKGIASVVAGKTMSCAITGGGALKCWGSLMEKPSLTASAAVAHAWVRKTPVNVAGLSSGVSDVAIGDDHACALLKTGTVRCWGSQVSGQLGEGATAGTLVPVEVRGLGAAAAVAAAGSTTCALLAGGAVACWGSNDGGILADGETKSSMTPVKIQGLEPDAVALSVAATHACVLRASGGIQCWGRNDHGQLGDGTTKDRFFPVEVRNLDDEAAAVATGCAHTCALLRTGAVACWGMARNGSAEGPVGYPGPLAGS